MNKTDASVLILCGGKGSRMGSATAHLPKTLVEVNGKPMLAHILNYFKSNGFNRFVLATGYLSNKVEEFLEAFDPELDARISNAGDDAGILARIIHAQEYFNGPLIVAYGDTFIDINYQKFMGHHLESRKTATIVVGRIQSPFGIVTTDVSRAVTTFAEKPIFSYYLGCFAIHRESLQTIDPALVKMADGEGLVRYFNQLAASGSLGAFCHEGLRVTFNTEPEWNNAQTEMRNYYTLRER